MKTFVLIAAILAVASADPSTFVIGGHDATPGQFPMTCSLQWGAITPTNLLCGASIINENWILSAAHCITDAPPFGVFNIVCGITDLIGGEATEQRRGLAEIILHEGYIGGVAPHDVCVFRLDAPLVFNAFVQPITFPEAGVIPTGYAILSGWGSTSMTNVPVWPNILQWVEKPIIDMAMCATVFGDDSPLYYNSNVCTGPMTGGKSSCNGDSGGPLMQGNVQVGIVNWGTALCGGPNSPSVYAQVSFYLDWIHSNIN